MSEDQPGGDPELAGSAHVGTFAGLGLAGLALAGYLAYADARLGAVVAGLLGLGALLFGPSRWRVDERGLTRIRGALPLWRARVAGVKIREVRVRDAVVSPRRGNPYLAGYWVQVVFTEPTRVATFTPVEALDLSAVPFEGGRDAKPPHRRAQRERAEALAQRIRDALGGDNVARDLPAGAR